MDKYMGFEIVETDSGYGARPEGSGLMIGMEGTLQGYKSKAKGKEAIKELTAQYATQTPD